MISIPQYSEFCDYGDLDGLERCVRHWLGKSTATSISSDAVEVYTKEKMVGKYIDIYQFLAHGD